MSEIRMPRYFFDSANGSRHADHEGVDLKDHDLAREYAIVYAGEVLKWNPTVLRGGRYFQVEVRDTHQTLLFTVTTYVTEMSARGDTK